MEMIANIIIWFDFVGTFGRGLLRRITKYSHTHGPWVFYIGSFCYRKVNLRNIIVSQLKDQKADAVIMTETKEIERI
jgi:hypothetical protein